MNRNRQGRLSRRHIAIRLELEDHASFTYTTSLSVDLPNFTVTQMVFQLWIRHSVFHLAQRCYLEETITKLKHGLVE